MGHDGPGNIDIAEGGTQVRPLEICRRHVCRGLSVVMSQARPYQAYIAG